LASLPLTLKLPYVFQHITNGSQWVSVALLLVAIAMIMLLIYEWLRAKKYGESLLQLASTPGVIGGQLAGVVLIPQLVNSDEGFLLKLSCMMQKGSGRSSHDEAIWQDERHVGDPLRDDVANTSLVPVLFAIPYDCQPTSLSGWKGRIKWRLDVSAKVPGIDYNTWFEVPVFETAESRPNFALDSTLSTDYSPPIDYDTWFSKEGIIRNPLTGGGVQLVFPAARNRMDALGTTVFILLWSIAIWMLLKAGLLFFVIVFTGIGLARVFRMLDLFLYRSVAEADPKGLTVRGGYFGIGRLLSLRADDVQGFAATIYRASEIDQRTNVVVDSYTAPRKTIAKGISSRLAQRAVIDELTAALKLNATSDGR
jgi:hypothetical protein